MSAAVTTTDSTSTGEPGHFDFAAYLESSRQQVEQALDGWEKIFAFFGKHLAG